MSNYRNTENPRNTNRRSPERTDASANRRMDQNRRNQDGLP